MGIKKRKIKLIVKLCFLAQMKRFDALSTTHQLLALFNELAPRRLFNVPFFKFYSKLTNFLFSSHPSSARGPLFCFVLYILFLLMLLSFFYHFSIHFPLIHKQREMKTYLLNEIFQNSKNKDYSH